MNTSTLSIRKLVAAIVLLMLLIFFTQWLVGYLTTGKLIITTNNKNNNITLTALSKYKTSKGFSKQTTGSLSMKVKSGGYVLLVQQGASGKSQYVTVKAHHTTRLSVVLPALTGVEPVVYDSAQDVVADSNKLLYLDPDDSSINQINNQDQKSEFGSDYGLNSINWVTVNYGVGQNSKGQLFVIDNGSVHALSSPISGNDDSKAVYAVAPNKKIYIGLGSSVYGGSEAAGFKKIYSNRPAGSFLLAGSDKVAILSSGYGGKPSITVVYGSGKQVSSNFSQPFNGWSTWSQNAKYMVVITGSVTEVLDASLHKVAVIPQGASLTYPVWLGDDTVFYSVGSQLWSYDIKSQSSQLVANMPLNNSIQSLSVSTDCSYVYLTTLDSNSVTAIRRVGLRGQKVPDIVYNLQDILPFESPGNYAAGLFNFSGPPTISIELYDGSNAAASLQSVQTQLQSSGFNLSQLRFDVEQGD